MCLFFNSFTGFPEKYLMRYNSLEKRRPKPHTCTEGRHASYSEVSFNMQPQQCAHSGTRFSREHELKHGFGNVHALPTYGEVQPGLSYTIHENQGTASMKLPLCTVLAC